MHEYSYEYTGRVLLRDNSLVVSRICAAMSETDNFASYTIGPFEVLCEFSGKCANFSRRVGHRRAMTGE